MRTIHTASKTICAASLVAFLFQTTILAQSTQPDNPVNRLLGSDPAVRGAAKAELLQHPDPAWLPALLEALPSSQGTLRDDLLLVLAKYDDPRKIPVFLALHKTSSGGTASIEEQLSHLGQPAAEALLANCTTNDEDYARWAAGVLSWMHEIGARYLIAAVQNDDACQHAAGEQGLLYMSDPDDVSRADTRLAADAAIDPDPKIRNAAKEWFATWKGKEGSIEFSGIVDALIAAYQSNASPETMVKIAQMLSDLERPRVTRFMRAAVHAPNPEIQRIANQYLSNHPSKPQPRSTRPSSSTRTPQQKIELLNEWKENSSAGNVNGKIIPFLRDSDAHVRATAASTLGAVNATSSDARQEREIDPATALGALRKALEDSSPEVRAAVAEAVGEMHSEDGADILVTALKDPNPSVVLSAAKALEQVPADAALPALTEIYRDDRNSPELKSQVLFALSSICSPDSIPIFLEVLRASNENLPQQVAQALACALKKHADPSAFQPILHALQLQPAGVQNSFLKASLIEALAETKNPEAFDTLVGLLKSSDFDVRQRAAGGLGLLGDKRAVPLLAGLLKDPEDNVRRSAAWSLTQFSNFSAPPELIAALQSGDTAVQIHVPNALAQAHDPKAIDALIAAMSTNPGVIYALGESREARSVPALIAFLENPANNTGSRATAATSLGKVGDLRAVEPLIASLKEDNGSVTMAASTALGLLKDKRAIDPLKQAYARWNTGQKDNADTVKVFIAQALSQLGVTDTLKQATGMPVP